VDGLVTSGGPTINALQKDLGSRFAGYRAPKTAELNAHKRALAAELPSVPLTRGIPSLRKPTKKAPVTDERASEIQREVSALLTTTDNTGMGRLYAGTLIAGGIRAVAVLGGFLDKLAKADKKRADEFEKAVSDLLPDDVRKEVFDEPPAFAASIGKEAVPVDDTPRGKAKADKPGAGEASSTDGKPTDNPNGKKAAEKSGENTAPVPAINMEKDRVANIQANKPARFEIKKNPKATGADVWYEFSPYGRSAVKKHNATVEEMSKKHGVDSDLVRAVMWAENARGHKGVLDELADVFQVSDRALPMNVDKNKWSGLIGKTPAEMYDPRNNIEAGVVLLDRITARIKEPTPEKVGSIWHHSGREITDDFGAFIQRVYDEKPWDE
jgi:hypothetical protein